MIFHGIYMKGISQCQWQVMEVSETLVIHQLAVTKMTFSFFWFQISCLVLWGVGRISDKLLHYWNHCQVPGDRQGPAIEEEDFESVSPKRGSGKRFSQIRSRKWLETGLQGEDPVSSTERCVFFLISCQLHNFHKASSMCQKVVIWYIIQNSQVAQPGPWQWWVVGDWRRY